MPQHLLKEIENFFDVFKDLEGKDMRVRGWEGAAKAQEALEAGISEGKKSND